MVKLFVILLVLLVNGGVSGQRRDPTPSLDLVNVPGELNFWILMSKKNVKKLRKFKV